MSETFICQNGEIVHYEIISGSKLGQQEFKITVDRTMELRNFKLLDPHKIPVKQFVEIEGPIKII